MVSPFPTMLSKDISHWPNRKRGELCLREFTSIDSLMMDSPLFKSIDSRHQLSIKSSMIKDDTLMALIVLSIIIEHSDIDQDDQMELEQDEGPTDGIPVHLRRQENCPRLNMIIHRYANFCPMLDEADDALSCAFSSALRAVPWSQFGQKLSLAERSSKKSDDEWLLKSIFTPPDEIQTRIHGVTIVANLSSNSGRCVTLDDLSG
jgi:hypothetical protein